MQTVTMCKRQPYGCEEFWPRDGHKRFDEKT
jgi:hypothetical protein